jgi:hypothetical protein
MQRIIRVRALIKKEKGIFLIYKEIQNGIVGLVIYEEELNPISGNAQIFNQI